ncbi:hypothetical protein [Pseudomonas sp. S1(2024)]|uniref:hypothetical protein n=1 Tax=Pseudomonas sp. S1(2024) TaxID=3390191 RepID=UPI003979532B
MSAPIPTPSASALHLLYAMRKSVGYSSGWQLDEMPVLECTAPGLGPLDPEDPGLTLFAELVNAVGLLQHFTINLLRFALRSKFNDLSQGWESQLPTLMKINALKGVPGGWRYVDVLWEYQAGVPLTEALLQHPIQECLNPAEDFTQGWKYEVMAFDSLVSIAHPDDDPYYDTHDLKTSFFANDLAALLKKLPDVSRLCDQELKLIADRLTGDEESAHQNDVCLKVLKAKSKIANPFTPARRSIMYICMDSMGCSDFPPEGRFDPRGLIIERDGQACLRAIEAAFGAEVADLYAEHCLGLDLGL